MDGKYVFHIKPVPGKEEIVKQFYYKPDKAHLDDSGIDLFCLDQQTFEPHSLANTIRFGISCELLKYVTTRWHDTCTGRSGGYCNGFNKPYTLVPRSSISKTPLRMSNSIGIIDSGYRGEMMAKVDNLSDQPWVVETGVSYFQLITPDMRPARIEIVSKLSETSRGFGGFGSTGNTS